MKVSAKKVFNAILLFTALLFLLSGCSANVNQNETGTKSEITASVIEDTSENCRFSDPSDCSPIEITRGEPIEEASDEIPAEERFNITDNPEYNITLQNLTRLSLACEAGWKCIKGRYIAYQEINCSWHSLERCIYGCNENESVCRTAPICKANSLRCENDNLMICGEEGHKWLLNKSCDKDCENNICAEDLIINATLNITTNISNNTTQNDFIFDGCMGVLNYNLTGSNPTDEYFTLKNSCPYQIDMSGWTVNDNQTHIYAFPSFNLASNGEVTVITGSGSNSQTILYWGRGSAVWNNGGDTLYLNASNSTNVLTKPLNP